MICDEARARPGGFNLGLAGNRLEPVEKQRDLSGAWVVAQFEGKFSSGAEAPLFEAISCTG
jgi:hypothetical protein